GCGRGRCGHSAPRRVRRSRAIRHASEVSWGGSGKFSSLRNGVRASGAAVRRFETARDECGPTRLMTRANASAAVAVKVFVEEGKLPPVRIDAVPGVTRVDRSIA